MLIGGENFGVSLTICLWACLDQSIDTKSQPQNSAKSSLAGLRLLALAPDPGPTVRVTYSLCREDRVWPSTPRGLPLGSKRTLGFTCRFPAVGIQRPNGLTLLRQDNSSERDWGMRGGWKWRGGMWQWHNSTLSEAMTQAGTLSSSQGWVRSLLLHPDFWKCKTFHSGGRVKAR